jgi:PiT family inorganic phosphate transporter
VLLVVVLLAWSNGSNDNFKGVSTLYGAGSASYKTALAWATAMQLAGSLLALVLAAGLIKTFSAKGLVPDEVATSPVFLAAAALGTALTVLLATVLGLPVSTTHGLTGALIGAGLATRAGVNFTVLGKSFVIPLLLSPVVAVLLTAALFVALKRAPIFAQPRVVRVLHFVSAGAVCFARGLNDTPKIVALLIAARAVSANVGLIIVGGAMAVGGLVGARKIAETMAKKITTLDERQGVVASLTTAALVVAASLYTLPVSTTHVATGGIFGIGAATGKASWKTIGAILTAWVTTLPLGAALAAAAYYAIR